MDGERWQEMWSLFEQAMERPPEKRDSFLDGACGGNAELRSAVEELLQADREANTFMEQPVVEPSGTSTFRAAPESLVRRHSTWTPPEKIGPYRVVRQIGEGGMGAVFLAVRDDDTFQRRVVIKLVRRGMENEDILRRLRNERQILASLDHPYIAELYDGGSTEDRLPYFVMEYVEGLSIDAFCDLNQLSIDDRMELFLKVCSAVRYAHQNLVIHRDIKPSNILVTAEGEPKLLDFGIAKVLNPDLASQEFEPTASWHRMLTPHYASPEQVRGKLVTTASDVYSLGVLFYKLLTGQLPHRLRSRSPQEIERILTDRVPLRPSQAFDREAREPSDLEASDATQEQTCRERGTTPQELRRKLQGDLDSIVLKALRSSPLQRYGSVDQLVADLERYQQGLAVLARKGTWRYRAGKFLGRHRYAVATSVTLLGLLTAFAVAMAWQSARVVEERDAARLERDKKQNVLALMLEVFGVDDPTLSDREKSAMTVGDAMARSEPILALRLREQPEVRAEILLATGTVYRRLGQHDRARGRVEEALTLLEALYGREHREVALARRALGKVLREQGEVDEALRHAREAVETLRRVGDAESDGAVREGLAKALNTQVDLLCAMNDYDAAEPLAREAVALARGMEGGERELAFALNSLAAVHSARGQYLEATDLYQQSVALLGALWGEGHIFLVHPLNNMGLAQRHLGHAAEAEATYRRTLEIQIEWIGSEHPDLAATNNNLAGVLAAQGRYVEAREGYQRALDVLTAAFGAGHRHSFLVQLRLASMQAHLGEASAAEERIRELLEEWRSQLPDGYWVISLGESLLGESLMAQKRYEEAEPLVTGSYLALLGQSRHRRKKEALDRVVTLYEALRRPDEGARYREMLEAPES